MGKTPQYTKDAVNKYRSKYDFIQIRFDKNLNIKERLSGKGNINDYICGLILSDLESDKNANQDAQETQISQELAADDNSCIEQETSENEANAEDIFSGRVADNLAEWQAIFAAQKAAQDEKEKEIERAHEERRMLEGEQRAEEFREMMRRRRDNQLSVEDQEKEKIRQDTIARAMCEM